jgi:hypothetical protein
MPRPIPTSPKKKQKKQKTTTQKKPQKKQKKQKKQKTTKAKGVGSWFKSKFTRRQSAATKDENIRLNSRLNNCLKINTFLKDRNERMLARYNEIARTIMNDNELKNIPKLRNLFATEQEQEQEPILRSHMDPLQQAESASPNTIRQIAELGEEEEKASQ